MFAVFVCLCVFAVLVYVSSCRARTPCIHSVRLTLYHSTSVGKMTKSAVYMHASMMPPPDSGAPGCEGAAARAPGAGDLARAVGMFQ